MAIAAVTMETAPPERQVPEENLCFESRSNAAAILLKKGIK